MQMTTTEVKEGEVISPGLAPAMLDPTAPMCSIVFASGQGVTIFGEVEAVWEKITSLRGKPDASLSFQRPHTETERRLGFYMVSDVRGIMDEGTHAEYWKKRAGKGKLAQMLGM